MAYPQAGALLKWYKWGHQVILPFATLPTNSLHCLLKSALFSVTSQNYHPIDTSSVNMHINCTPIFWASVYLSKILGKDPDYKCEINIIRLESGFLASTYLQTRRPSVWPLGVPRKQSIQSITTAEVDNSTYVDAFSFGAPNFGPLPCDLEECYPSTKSLLLSANPPLPVNAPSITVKIPTATIGSSVQREASFPTVYHGLLSRVIGFALGHILPLVTSNSTPFNFWKIAKDVWIAICQVLVVMYGLQALVSTLLHAPVELALQERKRSTVSLTFSTSKEHQFDYNLNL